MVFNNAILKRPFKEKRIAYGERIMLLLGHTYTHDLTGGGVSSKTEVYSQVVSTFERKYKQIWVNGGPSVGRVSCELAPGQPRTD